MLVSVILPTHDRARRLERTLASFTGVRVAPEQPWELVVVDNGSRDDTPAVLARMAVVLPPLPSVCEPGLGVSRARNAGVRAARGDLVLFTDDDVDVNPEWLGAYVKAAGRWPTAAYFAGRIDAEFEAPPPRWVTEQRGALSAMLCERDLGPSERRLGPDEYPFAPNMAVRRAAFAHAAFDERLGLRGRDRIRGSETSLFRALGRQGAWGVWAPSARVRHRVTRGQMTWRYFWGYYRSIGRAGGRLEPEADRATLALRARCWGHIGLGIVKRAAGRPNWIAHLQRAAYLAGLIHESRVLRCAGTDASV
jgi:glycosyltransferase involved in cell wall biosynthesis